ncbi:625fed22-b899-4cc7-96c8-1a05c37b4162 [Thermothielavioides terrestris]|uniref:625fed22-b899-4cc7-96c8-1a05c37b4162 n=1 Tax=Thermothielavioides terrestris TaxID=2587410 RepID=A0A3S4B1X1_9PEZI|nr:625fed22-b899-4cc7-96c8-1a05c37b4162 [Thermothielavioides terrestris]
MAGYDHGGGSGSDWGQGRASGDDVPYRMDQDTANLAPPSARHNGGHGSPGGRPPASPALSAGDTDTESRRSGERNRSRPRGARSASGQFVRALDGTFHLDCFRCRDCGQIVASKFFPADDEDGGGQYPLCETDYFRRLGLLCHQCGGALRGSYITALDRKYHVDHFTCSLCPTVFGAQDSYYEHDGQVYCHFHYSTQFAQRCNGCQAAILKQFVEIFRNGQNQHWHPECYMIHKFWNVRLNPPQEATVPIRDDPDGRERVRQEEERMEEKVYRIWSVLSSFEESSAACISDMLLHVSNGAYIDGVMVAKRFIFHVDILFRSADRLDATMAQLDMNALAYGREAKLLCKKIVAFFSLLSKTQDKAVGKPGVTQDLLGLVTGLAHYLKLLIRICLQGALRIEKERTTADGLFHFLDDLGDLETLKMDDNSTTTLQLTSGMSRLSAHDSDQCVLCRKPIEDECAKNGDKRWHLPCASCYRCGRELGRKLQDARLNPYDGRILCTTCEPDSAPNAAPFEHVTKLQQYVFLLQVALARLLEILRSNGVLPSSSSDPNGNGSGTADGRSGPHAGEHAHHRRESSYESALNDVRRLKSTRLDKHLSSSFRKARTSRILDGPESSSARPGSAGGGPGEGGPNKGFQIVEERGPIDEEDMTLPNQDALTLDDIPRIVAAERANREQRPYPPARQEFFRSPGTESRPGPGAPGGSGHQRNLSDGKAAGARAPADPSLQRTRRYFSELSGLEYFLVRHLAVLTMHPMVSSEFTLEELLSFIESRKPPTFWKNIGKAFKNDGRKNVKKRGVFGVPLEVIVERDGAESTDGVGPGTLRIPAVVDDIISSMKQMDLSVEGVFRKNGNIKKLGELVEKLDKEEEVDFSTTHVVQVAALLKRYLRELPDPLMTHKLYRLWLAAAKVPDEQKMRHCLHLTCCLLPKANRDCLEILFCFLKWVGSFHQVDDESGSKMDIKNLATVIAPNVLFDKNKTSSLDSDPMYAIEAVEVLIANIEEMCLVPGYIVNALNDPALFGSSGELTTKEILKRLSERAANGLGQTQYADVSEIVGRHEIPSRPPPRRMETDPSQWQQQESSVRPVQEPTAPFAGPPHMGTPSPKRGGPYDAPPAQQSPYGQFEHSGTPDANMRGGQGQREWRNSGWGRQNSGLTTSTV